MIVAELEMNLCDLFVAFPHTTSVSFSFFLSYTSAVPGVGDRASDRGLGPGVGDRCYTWQLKSFEWILIKLKQCSAGLCYQSNQIWLTAAKVNSFLLFPVVHCRLLCFADVERGCCPSTSCLVPSCPLCRLCHRRPWWSYHLYCTVFVMSEEEVCFPTLTIMLNAEL